MKKLITVTETSPAIDMALFAARIGLGTLMLAHGIPKMLMLISGGPVSFPGVMGMSPELSLSLAVFAEVLCSVLIIAGIGTRLATIPLIVTMLVAILVIHSGDPFAKIEPGLQYLTGYVILLLAGSGKYSFDYLLQKKMKPVRIKKLTEGRSLRI